MNYLLSARLARYDYTNHRINKTKNKTRQIPCTKIKTTKYHNNKAVIYLKSISKKRALENSGI